MKAFVSDSFFSFINKEKKDSFNLNKIGALKQIEMTVEKDHFYIWEKFVTNKLKSKGKLKSWDHATWTFYLFLKVAILACLAAVSAAPTAPILASPYALNGQVIYSNGAYLNAGVAPLAYTAAAPVTYAAQTVVAVNPYDYAGQVYPLAEPYLHQDVEAEPYVHEEVPAEEYVHQEIEAEAYVHDEVAAEPYVHEEVPAEPYIHQVKQVNKKQSTGCIWKANLHWFQEPITVVAAPAQVVSYAAPVAYAQAPVAYAAAVPTLTYATAPATNLVYSNVAAPTLAYNNLAYTNLGYNLAYTNIAQAPVAVAASA
jgi:hypothetical protein